MLDDDDEIDDEDEVDEYFLFDEQVGGGGVVARAIYDPSAVRPLTRVT